MPGFVFKGERIPLINPQRATMLVALPAATDDRLARPPALQSPSNTDRRSGGGGWSPPGHDMRHRGRIKAQGR
jgi:hypothetical protein